MHDCILFKSIDNSKGRDRPKWEMLYLLVLFVEEDLLSLADHHIQVVQKTNKKKIEMSNNVIMTQIVLDVFLEFYIRWP